MRRKNLVALGLCFSLAVGLVSGMADAGTVNAAEESSTVSEEDGGESIPIDEAHFPDEIFREYIGGVLDGCDTNFDNDSDGALSPAECAGVTSISLSGEPVKSLEGIEYFQNLDYLYIYRGLLTEVDLSGNPNLRTVDLSYNSKLTAIGLTGCESITGLRLSMCSSLTELDISDCIGLESLICYNDPLSGLDLSGCPALNYLDCQSSQLSELDVSANPKLTCLCCYGNKLTELDVSACTGMTNLNCGDNSLQGLDVSGLADLGYLDVSYNVISELNVTKNTALTSLYCHDNKLRTLDISQNTKLQYLNISGNSIAALDASANRKLYGGDNEPCWDSHMTGVAKETEDGSWLLDLSEQEGYDPEKLTVYGWEDAENPPEITESGIRWAEDPLKTASSLTLDYDLSNGYYLDGKVLRCTYSLESPSYDESEVELSEANFPDENFRDYLKENFDGDGDGKFQPGTVHDLYVGSKGIRDLTGIEYFTSLTYLDCGCNEITQLDLSKNTCLTCVYAGGQTVSVDIAKKDGVYTAESDFLSTVLPEEIQDGSILRRGSQTEAGYKWTEDPMDGAYTATDYINRSLVVGNEDYTGNSTFLIYLEFHNTYDTFDMEEVPVDEEHFPDKAFRTYLKDNYDTDGDGKFQPGLVSSLYLSWNSEIKDLTGIAYFTSLTGLYLENDTGLTELDVSQNTNLQTLYVDGTKIQSLDLRNNASLQNLYYWGAPITSLYLAKDCLTDTYFSETNISSEAVEEDGSFVLDLSKFGDMDWNRIVEISDGERKGDKLCWASESEVPTVLTYRFLLRDDYEAGMEYGDRDVMTVRISLANNAPPAQQGKEIALTAENFPSEQLLSKLKRYYDGDADGILNTADVTYLDLGEEAEGMTSLAGIENLNCLASLSVGSLGSLTSLDLSGNPVLTSLCVYENSLKDVNISECPYLEFVSLTGNSLSKIDVSGNALLRDLDLGNNSLTKLDLSKNKQLRHLYVEWNALRSLDLSGNTRLETLQCSSNPNLSELKIGAPQKLRSLEVMGDKLDAIDLAEMTGLTSLWVDNNQDSLSTVDLTENKKLETLYTSGLEVTTDWSGMEELSEVSLGYGITMEELDLSAAKDLSCLYVDGSLLTDVSVNGCSRLKNLNINGGRLESLDIEGCEALSELSCCDGKLETLDVTGCQALKTLNCANNSLENLDVTKNEALQGLYCYNNKLSTVDTTHNLSLKWFECYGNPIVSLDLSKNRAMLTDLTCYDSSLTSLNVEENEVLENVNLSNQEFSAGGEDFMTGTSGSAVSPVNTSGSAVSPTPATGTAVMAMRSSCSLYSVKYLADAKDTGVSEGYCLYLDKYGDFDPERVTDLSSGTAVEQGILWDDVDEIPNKLTYTYDISNNYKLSQKEMKVTVRITEKPTAAPTPTKAATAAPAKTAAPTPTKAATAAPAKTAAPTPTKAATAAPTKTDVSAAVENSTAAPKPTSAAVASPDSGGESSAGAQGARAALNKSKLTLYTAGRRTAKLRVTGVSGRVTWKSSNNKIVKVSASGTVKAMKKGKVKVEARAGDVKLSCAVTVKKPKISVKKKKLSLRRGKKKKLSYVLKPKGGKPVFKVQKKKIASVSAKGVVKAKKRGKTKIVINYGGRKAAVTLTVE